MGAFLYFQTLCKWNSEGFGETAHMPRLTGPV